MKTYKQLKESLLGKKVNKALDVAQVAGDVVGLVDPTPITDLVNAGVSGVRAAVAKDPEERKDHLINAGLRAVSAVPYAGDAVGKTGLAVKMGVKGAQAAKTTKTASTAARAGKTGSMAAKAEEAALRKEMIATKDPNAKRELSNKIRELQTKAREEAQRQSKERLNQNDSEETE